MLAHHADLGVSASRRLTLICVAVLCALSMPGLAMAQSSSREQALSRILHERARQYQVALYGAAAVKTLPLDAFGPIAAPANAVTLLARMSINQRRATERSDDLFASLGASTEDKLLNRAIEKTYKNMLSAPISCCLCSSAAECNDNLFCNGVEVCQNSRCGAGPDPCIDGDVCTTDACIENADLCSFQPVAPPAEVAVLNVHRDTVVPTVAVLQWSSVPGANAYNIYRGEKPNLGDLSCFVGHVVGTTQNDGAMPPSAFVYLVTALGCGESTLGDGNPGMRPAPPGCP